MAFRRISIRPAGPSMARYVRRYQSSISSRAGPCQKASGSKLTKLSVRYTKLRESVGGCMAQNLQHSMPA